MGEGYTWETQNREQYVAAAHAAWDIVAGMLKDDSYDLILLNLKLPAADPESNEH